MPAPTGSQCRSTLSTCGVSGPPIDQGSGERTFVQSPFGHISAQQKRRRLDAGERPGIGLWPRRLPRGTWHPPVGVGERYGLIVPGAPWPGVPPPSDARSIARLPLVVVLTDLPGSSPGRDCELQVTIGTSVMVQCQSPTADGQTSQRLLALRHRQHRNQRPRDPASELRVDERAKAGNELFALVGRHLRCTGIGADQELVLG